MKLFGASVSQLSARLGSVVAILVTVFMALAASSAAWSQTYPTQIGMNVSDYPPAFMDVFKDGGRPCAQANGTAVPTDPNGNPLADCR
jgi:hypothetical protein